MPVSENMQIAITTAYQGLRRARPLKSSIISASKPWRDISIITPKTPSVVST